MFQNNSILLITSIVSIILFILYRLFFKKDTFQEEYEQIYSHIINSDEYKAKSQFDKD